MLWVSSTRGSIVGRAQCHAAPASATAVDGRRATVPVTRAERETAASENKLRKADLAEPRAPTPPQLEPATNSGAQVYSARDRSVSRDLRRAFRRAPTARHSRSVTGGPVRRGRCGRATRSAHPASTLSRRVRCGDADVLRVRGSSRCAVGTAPRGAAGGHAGCTRLARSVMRAGPRGAGARRPAIAIRHVRMYTLRPGAGHESKFSVPSPPEKSGAETPRSVTSSMTLSIFLPR